MQPEPTTQELLDRIAALKEDRAWEARRANEAARLSAEARDDADHLRKQIADLQEQVKIVEEDRTRHDAWAVRVCHQHGIDLDRQVDDLDGAIARYIVVLKAERDQAIAHDRQPYPTADAFEKACAALEKHRARADAAEADRDRVWAVIQAAREAARRTTAIAIASGGRIDTPTIDRLRRALGMRGTWPTGCRCDLHGRTCEPPSELCCEKCTETQHPDHADGSACSAPDLSGSHMATAVEIALRVEVDRLAELVASRTAVFEAARAYWARHGKLFLGPQSAERDALVEALTQSTVDGAP